MNGFVQQPTVNSSMPQPTMNSSMPQPPLATEINGPQGEGDYGAVFHGIPVTPTKGEGKDDSVA